MGIVSGFSSLLFLGEKERAGRIPPKPWRKGSGRPRRGTNGGEGWAWDAPPPEMLMMESGR